MYPKYCRGNVKCNGFGGGITIDTGTAEIILEEIGGTIIEGTSLAITGESKIVGNITVGKGFV